jgi:hypothetical protein
VAWQTPLYQYFLADKSGIRASARENLKNIIDSSGEEERPSETSVEFEQTKQSSIPQDRTLHEYLSEDLKAYKVYFILGLLLRHSVTTNI